MPEKWTEKEIKECLKSMPDIKDNRSAEDILNRLKKEERLQEVVGKKQKSFGWLPVAAIMAAILFIGLLLPSMLKMNQPQYDEMADRSLESDTANDAAVSEEASILSEDRLLDSHVEDVFLNMLILPNDQVILEHIAYDVMIDEVVVYIHFKERLDLSTLKQEEATALIESFLLTAEQFNLNVQFENITPTQFGAYDLSMPLSSSTKTDSIK